MYIYATVCGDKKNTILMTISLDRLNTVPMVLNPHRIKPTFLQFDSWSPGGGYYSNYNLQCIRLDRESKSVKKSFKHKKEN